MDAFLSRIQIEVLQSKILNICDDILCVVLNEEQ